MARRDYHNDPAAPRANSIVPAVTGVVVDPNGRLLLIRRRDNDRWALPGGGVEIGESVPGALAREVLEETGITVELTGIVGIYSDPGHIIAYDDGEVRQEFSICLRARPTGGILRGSDESTEVAWVDPGDLDSLEMHPSQRLRLRHALDRPPGDPYLG